MGKSPEINWNGDFAQVISGGLLGDGCMSLQGRAITPTYEETHGYRQRDYILWKCRVLGGSSRDATYFDKRTGRFYLRSYMWVIDDRNQALYALFYHRGRKAITYRALSHMNELGLTVLWLDDGSTKLHDGNGKLSLQSFLPNENRLIMRWLERQYGIESVLTCENEIFFNSREMPKLLSCVYPVFKTWHFPACMSYKMGFMEPQNARAIEEAKEARRSRDRAQYRKVMMDPVRKAKLHETVKKARWRRMQDLEYRRKYNEYQKEYMRMRRARHAQ